MGTETLGERTRLELDVWNGNTYEVPMKRATDVGGGEVRVVLVEGAGVEWKEAADCLSLCKMMWRSSLGRPVRRDTAWSWRMPFILIPFRDRTLSPT